MKVIDGNALANELHASIQDELQILRMSAVRPSSPRLKIAALIVPGYGAAFAPGPATPG